MSTLTSSTPNPGGGLYPRRARAVIVLELEIPDAEKDSYIFSADSLLGPEALQIGFLADLFDLLNFEATLGVEKINGYTHAQITKALKAE